MTETYSADTAAGPDLDASGSAAADRPAHVLGWVAARRADGEADR
ncbi:hypothetical protein ABEU20_001368 [Rhodococcus sp. PAM 2766]|uniref:Uncharacterized protein n=1 Tax=Rhodococcus parequi TaxID=3137122 RepID=A0ABW9FC25_9NOCA